MASWSNFFALNLGTVLSANGFASDQDQNPSPSVQVQSFLDGSVQTLPLDLDPFFQAMPMPGHKVAWFRLGRFPARIFARWGANESFLRKGNFGLNQGELQIQSPAGLAYLRFDRFGGIQLVSGDTIHNLTFGKSGAILTSSIAAGLQVGNTACTISQDGSASITQTDDRGNIVSQLTLDSENRMIADIKGDIILKSGTKIMIDAPGTLIGEGASDPSKDSAFVGGVSGAPDGTFPTDPSTGSPVPGSSTVRISS